MKAIVHTAYGPADELQFKEVQKPVPNDDEVLIKIHATTVSTSDCNLRNQTFVPKVFWLPTRLQFGLTKPKINILGFDFAGEIEAVGKDVGRFKIGDQVFGTSEPVGGAHAQYICMPENGVLEEKPVNMSYEEAATIPVAATAAYHFLRDMGQVQPGQQVLINGASGAVGTFAVQLAKAFGVEVTGVCSTRNLDLVHSLEADQVIDYTKEDFTQNGRTYDLILDAVSSRSFSQCKDSLKQNGIYLITVPTVRALLQMGWTARGKGKKVKVEGAPAKVENLRDLKGLIEAGKLKTVIDSCYPLEETAKAFTYVEGGHKRGNVVIKIENNN